MNDRGKIRREFNKYIFIYYLNIYIIPGLIIFVVLGLAITLMPYLKDYLCIIVGLFWGEFSITFEIFLILISYLIAWLFCVYFISYLFKVYICNKNRLLFMWRKKIHGKFGYVDNEAKVYKEDFLRILSMYRGKEINTRTHEYMIRIILRIVNKDMSSKQMNDFFHELNDNNKNSIFMNGYRITVQYDKKKNNPLYINHLIHKKFDDLSRGELEGFKRSLNTKFYKVSIISTLP